MIVLGFDTSTPATAVALRLADGRALQARDDPAPGAHPAHATRLLDMARGVLTQAGLRWSEIDRIAVGVGPGTFTGLRVGVATARGLAQSLDAELVGVSSLQALAEGAGADAEGVLAVIDARRGEVFAAAYERAAGLPPRELTRPRALAPERLAAVLDEARGARPDAAAWRWLSLGDGAVRYPEQVDAAGLSSPAPESEEHRVSATAICALALAAEPVGARALLPDYCRRPDAELALEVAGAGGAS